MDKKIYNALASAIYVNAMTLNGKNIDTADQKIRASGLYDDFDETKAYSVGNVFNTHSTAELGAEWEQTWECHAAIDPAKNPGVIPGVSAWFTFFHPLHGKSAETARDWVKPQYGTTDIYKCGEYMKYIDGFIYPCIAENGTNFSPDEYRAAWGDPIEAQS